MRAILTLPSLRDPGGVAGFYNSVLPRLADRGVEISTLEIGGTRGAFGLLHPVRDQIELASRLRREPADLVHVNPSLDARSFLRDGLFVGQGLRRRMPVVVFFHGWLSSFETVVEGRLRGFFQRTYGKADTFLVLARAFAEKLRQWGITAPIQVTTTVIPDELIRGFSLENRLERLAAVPPARILFLARVEPGKGIFETIQAVELLVREGLDVSLDVAGDGSALPAAEKEAASRPALRGRVRFIGYVRGEAKKAILEQSDVYCFPSHSEGMPLSILEAMAFGLPVVTRAVGGIAEFFQDGAMGYAASGPDPRELAALLKRLLGDRGRMAEMARTNHAWTMRNCRASGAAARLEESYREARERGRATS
jgi:glycosyltransferase involved in cell wall biosynthesis